VGGGVEDADVEGDVMRRRDRYILQVAQVDFLHILASSGLPEVFKGLSRFWYSELRCKV
jgi:hypothetical protein